MRIQFYQIYAQDYLLFSANSSVDWYGGQFVQIAKKLGLPEIIYPSDNRNDLYVVINWGKFSKGNKLQHRNVEVTLEVCDEKGKAIEGAISSGVGPEDRKDSFKSVVYRHSGK